MKKVISVILSVIMLCSFALTGCAEEINNADDFRIILQINNPEMFVNGEKQAIDDNGTAPVIINDRAMLPIRAVIEAMGGTAEWDGGVRKVTLNYGSDEVILRIDSTKALFNGEEKTLDSAPAIINDRTMLPIRFIAESFGFDISWEQSTQTIIIERRENEIKNQGEIADAEKDGINENERTNALVLYFSATGTTANLAKKIADVSGADICEIVPEDLYTSEDLNYNSDCRANAEQNDKTARPAIKRPETDIYSYDTIILGYPIWWGTLPKIIYTLTETYDLSGKKIMPFCTSGSSGISASVEDLKLLCESSMVTDGFRGTSSTTDKEISEWLENNGFRMQTSEDENGGSNVIYIKVNDTVLKAELVDNSSTGALKELLKKGDITIDMEDYGGFEKVGPIGESLPTNNEQITTEAGDLILYQGSSFVIYYDTNSWSFTRLGKICDITQDELKSLLGEGNINITLSIND